MLISVCMGSVPTGSLRLDAHEKKLKRDECHGNLKGNHSRDCIGLTPFEENVTEWRREALNEIERRGFIPEDERRKNTKMVCRS